MASDDVGGRAAHAMYRPGSIGTALRAADASSQRSIGRVTAVFGEGWTTANKSRRGVAPATGDSARMRRRVSSVAGGRPGGRQGPAWRRKQKKTTSS